MFWNIITEEWRKLHSVELHNLYLSPNIIRQIKSRKMRWVGKVAHMEEEREVYKVLVGKPEARRPLWKPDAPMGGWDQNGSWGDWLGGCGVGSPGSGSGLVAGCCDHGDERLGSGITELVSSQNFQAKEFTL
jgi:hypothetical protein